MQHPNHPDHDPILIAGLAGGDLDGSEHADAQAVLDSCDACAELHRDLIAIAAATRSLPALATAPRDFRLTPEQAARLHRQGWLRTILAPFGTARSATRPIAAAFTSLGIAGLLVATFLPGLMGSATTSSAGEARDQVAINAGPTSAAGATSAPAAPEFGAGKPVAGATQDPDAADAVTGGNSETGAPRIVAGNNATQAPDRAADDADRAGAVAAANPLFIGSLALLALGLLLFGLRLAGRRLR